MDDVAVLVAQHLDLDMARIGDVFLDENPVVIERRGGFRPRPLEAFLHFGRRMGDAHAFAAAARRRLDHHRIPDLGSGLDRPRQPSRWCRQSPEASKPPQPRQASWPRSCRPSAAIARALGPMNTMPSASRALAKACLLGEEPVSRVHGFRSRLPARGDDLVDDQIGLGRGCRADVHPLVGHRGVQRTDVGVRKDGDRPDAHAPRCPDHPAGDLAAIGNQQFLEHRCPVCRPFYLPVAGP